MRYQGKIASWNAQRGFGFIKPQSQPQSYSQQEQRDADLFVHVSSLTFDGRPPEPGERVSYRLGTDKDDKPCAVQVFFPDRPLSLADGFSPAPDRPLPTDNESSRSSPSKTPSRSQSTAPRARPQPTYRRKGSWQGKLIPLLVLAGIFSIYSRFSAETPSPLPAASFSQNEASSSYSAPQTPAFARQCDGRQHCAQMTSCEEATWFLRNCPNMKMDGEGDGIPCEQQWCTGW
ncbi:cold shock domain-containing protein [Aeromonas lusitana]|uniref:DNA-binding protein n=1 Tax=Aeromonas lusitana TaxID=931529 RepID=A0A2M8H5H7_9GAMM|nr:cold shock domain-containing protein [Aeromonas lusitana]PJC91813.1 DNA-binding protein [Aeromonas lusitana]